MPYIPTAASLLVPATSAIRMVAHHEMVDLPGGPFVMGSSHEVDASPHWVHLSPFGLGRTAVMVWQFREFVSCGGDDDPPPGHPVMDVSWNMAQDYFLRINAMKKIRLGFPTEAEWEFAARGPAVDLREVMEAEGIAVDDFADFVKHRFENFVERIEMGSKILTDPTGEELQSILRTKTTLYAWRVYGTPSGRPTDNKPAPECWDSANAYGLKGITASNYEWVADWFSEDYYQRSPSENPMGPEDGEYRSLRGGSFYGGGGGNFHAARRDFDDPDGFDVDHTFRVAVAAPEDSK